MTQHFYLHGMNMVYHLSITLDASFCNKNDSLEFFSIMPLDYVMSMDYGHAHKNAVYKRWISNQVHAELESFLENLST